MTQRQSDDFHVTSAANVPAVTSAATNAATAAFNRGEDPIALGGRLLGWHAEAVAAVRRRLPLAGELACSTGCAWCCHLKVTLTPLEALRLLSHLRSTLSAETMSQLKRRVRDADRQTRAKTAEERLALALPCPLLGDDKRCTAYEARPLSCAGTNSYDAEGCKRGVSGEGSADEIPHDPVQLVSASAVASGVTEATFASQKDGRILELVAALRVGLDDPEAKSKWSRGMPVFQAAIDPEFDALMRGKR
ncbi:MAG: hypothetical protein HOV80_24045 [Polyangiaceae bacterium]|nr:hypothetical protein [Polyangiaceae bacterium]